MSTAPAAERVDAVVVGGGIGGLTAAWTLALRGQRVVVLEADDVPGGPVRGGHFATLPDVPVDVGVESFAVRGAAVAELAADLGLTGAAPAAAQAWGFSAGRTFPLPAAGLLGIPSVPWAPDVRRAIGWPGVARASLDRVLPARLVNTSSLGALVRSRMGRRVTDRLVTLIAAGVHSATVDTLDVQAVAPGLLDAYAREGSLSKSVGSLRRNAPAGSLVRGIDGGIHAIVEALVGHLNASADEWGDPAAAGVRCGRRVEAIARDGRDWRVTDAAGAVVTAPRLIAATPNVAPLLAPILGVEPPTATPGAPIALVALLLDAPELDTAPRGTGMLIGPDSRGHGTHQVSAKAFTHATAKWPWLAERVRKAAGPGVHIVRLSYGRLGDMVVEPDVALATRDASVLLGVDLTGRVRDHLIQRWDGSLPPPTPAYRAALTGFTDAVAACEGLGVVGGWVAGTGLASIVPHARAAAATI